MKPVMRDLVYVLVIVAFFALATIFVAGCGRIIGSAAPEERER